MKTQLILVFTFAILANSILSSNSRLRKYSQHQRPPHHQHPGNGEHPKHHKDHKDRKGKVFLGGSNDNITAISNTFGVSSAEKGSTSTNISSGSAIAQKNVVNMINSDHSLASNFNIPTMVTGSAQDGGHGNYWGQWGK